MLAIEPHSVFQHNGRWNKNQTLDLPYFFDH